MAEAGANAAQSQGNLMSGITFARIRIRAISSGVGLTRGTPLKAAHRSESKSASASRPSPRGVVQGCHDGLVDGGVDLVLVGMLRDHTLEIDLAVEDWDRRARPYQPLPKDLLHCVDPTVLEALDFDDYGSIEQEVVGAPAFDP